MKLELLVAASVAASLTLVVLPAAADVPPGSALPPPSGAVPPPPPQGYAPQPPQGYAPQPQGYAPYYTPAPTYFDPAFAVRPTERRSTAAMAVGIVMIAAGGVMLLAGTTVALSARTNCFATEALNTECHRNEAPGIALGIVGAVMIAAGIPVLVYGAARVPVKPVAGVPSWLGTPTVAFDPRTHAGAVGWRWEM